MGLEAFLSQSVERAQEREERELEIVELYQEATLAEVVTRIGKRYANVRRALTRRGIEIRRGAPASLVRWKMNGEGRGQKVPAQPERPGANAF